MSKLSRNILYNLLGQGLVLLLGFAAVKYVFKQLGDDALGIIYFTATFSAVLSGLLELGVGSTIVREVSSHLATEPTYIHNLLRTATSFYWAAYVLVAMGTYGVAPVIVGKWVHLKTLDSATATQVLRLLGIASLLALPRSFYVSALRGLQKMEFNNFIDVATSAMQQGGTVLTLVVGGGLLNVAYWLAVSFALGILAYVFVVGRFLSFTAFIPGFFSSVVRRNLSYTTSLASISILAMILTQADKVIVSKLLPLSTFGYYALVYGVVSKGTLMTTSTAQAALPSLSELFNAEHSDALISQYRKLQDLLCFAIVPIFAAILFGAMPVFSYLLNVEVARMLLLPLTLLCVGFYMNGTLSVPYMFSLAVGRPDIVARSNFYALFVVLPATGLLIYRFELGGAAFSWVFYHLFAYSYVVPRICSKCLNIPVWKWFVHVLKPMLWAALTYGFGWGILAATSRRSLLAAVLIYALASIVFLTAAYRAIGSELRKTLKQLPLWRGGGSQALAP